MFAKVVIVVIFLGILASLGSALVYLVKDKGQSDRTLKALTLRISISIALFAMLYLLWWLGLIQPHGLTP
ncbi:MAG: twin transmembrane helix small protein [Gammaproteobacteria bacterium]|nr:twin transmembrane helix small protein [Gammaproteobacteria bacterium]